MFNKLTRVEHTYLSNKTLFMLEVYIVLLHKAQLHVSAPKHVAVPYVAILYIPLA